MLLQTLGKWKGLCTIYGHGCSISLSDRSLHPTKTSDMGNVLHVHTKTFHNFMSTWYTVTACVNDCTMSDISTRTNMAQEQTTKHHRPSFPETSVTFTTVTFPIYYTDVTHTVIPDCIACPHLEHKFHTIKHAMHILSKELTNYLTNYSWEANISSVNKN